MVSKTRVLYTPGRYLLGLVRPRPPKGEGWQIQSWYVSNGYLYFEWIRYG